MTIRISLRLTSAPMHFKPHFSSHLLASQCWWLEARSFSVWSPALHFPIILHGELIGRAGTQNILDLDTENTVHAMMVLMFECSSPPKFVCWNPKPKGVGVSKWGLWRWLGHESGALLTGTSVLTKETSQSSLSPCNPWGHREKALVMNRTVSLHQNMTMLVPLTLDFQLPELQEIYFCCL